MKHIYYLHENGDLIHKGKIDGSIAADIRESPFARGLWFLDTDNREDAWSILVEALAGGDLRRGGIGGGEGAGVLIKDNG